MWQISLIFSLIFNSVLGQVLQTPVVNIVQGAVIGLASTHGNFYEFHGIPYADSTSGSHRFQAPSPPPTFQDTFIANRNDIRCVRALGDGYEGTEDCLVANVFTPSVNSSSRLSVMVWIKGREFDRAYDHQYSFKNFVEQNVVIVTLNYRESILGFLCLGTQTAPGNAGLKDIIAGLRWVQENIVQFGGNPDDITLFGHGSGAAAVDLITMSPMASGLVQKAIAQSGNAFAPWAVSRDNLAYAVQVAEALGHVVTNIQELSNVFTRTSVAALMAIINELDLTDNSLAFAPCLERDDVEGVQPFLTKSPYQTIADGEQLQIPFIMGYVDNEGTIRAEEALHYDWLERMENSFTEFIQPDLEFENEEQEAEVADEIKTFYFRDGIISLTTIDDYISYHGDTMMLVSTIREARMRALTSSLPIYLYQFSYKGSLGEAFAGPLDVESAAHSEELAYLFYDAPNENTPLLDLTVGDNLVERWTNFAKTGIPFSEISLVPWRPYTPENSYYLRILDTVEVNEEQETIELDLENPHPETISFWDSIYDEHFLDAEGKWELTDRNDEDEENIVEDSGESDNEDGGEIEGEPIIEEDGDDDENVPDSASTVIGYTLPILIVFSILNKFHLDKMLS